MLRGGDVAAVGYAREPERRPNPRFAETLRRWLGTRAYLPPGEGAQIIAPLGIKSGYTTIQPGDPVFFTWGQD